MLKPVSVIAFALAMFVATHANTQAWEEADPAALGWSDDNLTRVKQHAMALKPTAFMIVQDGKVVAGWGDVSRKVNVASVRKSLLSALYGIAVQEKRISLTSSLAELDIDDSAPSLTDIEKTATVRDLLMAHSGIYHPAAYETGDIKRKRPKRESHPPGSFWFYNNWDFNALGTIYRQQTGEDIFESFDKRIARPIGMEDFRTSDGQYVAEKFSEHPAYPFRLSARDAARFGQLFLDSGRWEGRQIVPASWVKESTTAYSMTKRGRQGYGYMWWSLPSSEWGEGAAYAAGYGGQIIAFIPAKRLVVVQTVDPKQNQKGIRTSAFIKVLKEIAAAAPSGPQ